MTHTQEVRPQPGVGMEFKAAGTVTPIDSRLLAWLRDEPWPQFVRRIVFHTGPMNLSAWSESMGSAVGLSREGIATSAPADASLCILDAAAGAYPYRHAIPTRTSKVDDCG